LDQNKKIKTLFISSWYPNRMKPTLGNFVQKHAEAAARFSDVTVLHVCFDNCKNKFEIVHECIGKINTTIIYIRKPILPLCKFFRYLKAYRLGLSLVRKNYGDPDMIHASVLFPVGMVFLFNSAYKKIPFVFSEHWTGYLTEDPSNINFLRKYLSRKIARKARCIMPVSENLKNAMIRFGFDGNYKVVPNVVDTDLFKPAVSEPASKKNILHVSSLMDDQKNISGMLRVIKRLAEKRHDFFLNIISDGEQEPFIQMAKNDSLLDNFVIFHGSRNTADVAEMMRHSDFLLLFSNYENQPCVITEAYASGIPVVSTDVGGIREHLSEKQGILINPKDEDALFASIDKMLDICRTFDKKNLHQYAVNNFSYDSIGIKFLEIYTEALKH
jgi:L-malate glycosyltransferase